MKKRIFLLILTFAMLFASGCGETATATETSETTAESPTAADSVDRIDPVLIQRRDTAESYMRSMLTVLWSPEEDILYALDSKAPAESAKQMLLRSDRIYQGMPYGFAGSTLAAFMEYCQPDGDLYQLSGLHWKALSGSSLKARIGLDGSSSLVLSWCQVSTTTNLVSTKTMVTEQGFLPVGPYKTTATKELTDTQQYCRDNGEQIMYESYSQMLKADGFVRYTPKRSQAMMAVSVSTVYNEDGTINGQESTITVLEQNKDYFLDETHVYNEELGCDVYQVGGIDVVYSFLDLYTDGYLPITCKELNTVTEHPEPKITDSNNAQKWETCMKGTIKANYNIDSLIITIYDESGNVVQDAAVRTERSSKQVISLTRFLEDDPGSMRGAIDIDALDESKYRFVLVCRLINGEEHILRDFTFSKGD